MGLVSRDNTIQHCTKFHLISSHFTLNRFSTSASV